MRFSAACLFAASLLCGPSARAETLTFFNWESYVDPELVQRWSAKTGVEVRQVFYDSGDARDELFSNANNDIDVAVLAERGASLFGRRGLLERFDAQNLPAIEGYDEKWRARCSAFGVPYLWGTLGIVYRTDKLAEPPRSWNDLLRPKPALKGHIGMYDDYADAILPALVLLGKPAGTDNERDLKAVFELLRAQAPSVLTYHYVMTASQNPDFGPAIHMAIGYSGDQRAMNLRDGTPGRWGYVLPAEGSASWVDCLAVRANSPRKALAMDLVRFLAEPENAAANSQFLGVPTPSLAALPLLPAAFRNDPETFPPAEVAARTILSPTLSEKGSELRRRIVNSLVNFHDAE